VTSVDLGIPVVPSTGAASNRPDTPALVDTFGRAATDLRVSLTDRCNLRCTYCMPAEGLDWLPGSDLLADEELIRLVRVAVTELGVTDVRFTGGEPLLRKGLERIIAATAALAPRPRISMTTNGISLARRADALVAAGLNRINVSLDTLRQDRFTAITRRNRLEDVHAGLAAAKAAGLSPVKVNAVLLRGVNDDEATDLLEYCLRNGYQLRFIEQMPLDPQHGWDRADMITAEEILSLLAKRFRLSPSTSPRGGAPAERWLVDGGPGDVGVIGSVTRPFCGDCERTRLTADGQMRNCLFANGETDLRAALRSGADDEQIANLWRGGMWTKLAGHEINADGFAQPIRPMSAIGG
jgi:cyclic pyranopterin phosphate synthase